MQNHLSPLCQWPCIKVSTISHMPNIYNETNASEADDMEYKMIWLDHISVKMKGYRDHLYPSFTFKLTFSCPKNLSELTWLDTQVPLKSFKIISYVDFSPRFFPRNVPSLKPQNLPGRIHKHRLHEFIQQIEIWFGAFLLTSSSFSKEIWALKNMCLLKALSWAGRNMDPETIDLQNTFSCAACRPNHPTTVPRAPLSRSVPKHPNLQLAG